MKKLKRVLAFTLAGMMLILGSCAKKPADPENPDAETSFAEIVKDGKSDYVIVVPKGNTAMFDEGFHLSNAIAAATGVKLKVVQDTHDEQAKEILVGITSRTVEGTYADGFQSPADSVLAAVGDKVLFYGGTVSAVQKAIGTFTAEYLNKMEGSVLRIPHSACHRVLSDAPYLKFVKGGASDYVIVSKPSEESYAKKVQAAVEKETGVRLPVVTGSNTRAKEIVVGEGGRTEGTEVKNLLKSGFEAMIAAKGEKLVICGGGEAALDCIISYFTQHFKEFMFMEQFTVSADYQNRQNFGEPIAKNVIESINALPDPNKIHMSVPVETSRIYTPDGSEDAWYYTHHPFITNFNGNFYVFYSSGRRNEDDCGQRIMMAVSKDCKNWDIKPLVDSIQGKYAEWVLYCKGVYIDGDTMRVFYEGYEYQEDVLRKNPDGTPLRPKAENHRAIPYGTFYLETENGTDWTEPKSMGRWKGGNLSPEKLPNGRLIWPGYASLSYTDNPNALDGWVNVSLKMDPDSLPKPKVTTESGFFSDANGVLYMFSRTNSNFLICSASFDNGTTWTPMYNTKIADHSAKFQFGTLPDGRYYFIGNNSGGRKELLLMISENGVDFDEWYYLGDTEYTQLKEGMYKGGDYGYPTTYFDSDYLYVVYSCGKEALEVTRVRLSDIGVRTD